MSKYTTDLRNICRIYGREEVESWFTNYELTDYLTQERIDTIQKSGIWSKEKLAKKIVDHYYMREIGFETPWLFRHYAIVTMREIMERKLPVIYTNCIEYDPFESVDFHITEKRDITGDTKSTISSNTKSNGNSNSSSNSTNSNLQVNSNTPQGQISKSDILNGKYASNTGANEGNTSVSDETQTSQNADSSSNSSSNNHNIELFTHDERGNKGVLDSYQKMIMQLRETFVAVDEEIITELQELFMGLY